MSGGRAILSLVLAAVVAAPGCVTSTQDAAPRQRPAERRTTRTRSATTPPPRPGGTGARRGTKDLDTDPCATQLHAIAGAMLMHYALHKRLPDALEGLGGLSGFGEEELKFSCPVSGLRYGYSPTGLEYQGEDKRLIVYDATPAHGGTRWGILAAAPKGTHPAATWVVQLPEGTFRLYQAPPQIPIPPEAEPEPTPGTQAPPDPSQRVPEP